MRKTVDIDGNRIVVLDEHGNEIGSVAWPPNPEREFEELFPQYVRKNIEGEESLTNEGILKATVKACNDISEDENVSFDVRQFAKYRMNCIKRLSSN